MPLNNFVCDIHADVNELDMFLFFFFSSSSYFSFSHLESCWCIYFFFFFSCDMIMSQSCRQWGWMRLFFFCHIWGLAFCNYITSHQNDKIERMSERNDCNYVMSRRKKRKISSCRGMEREERKGRSSAGVDERTTQNELIRKSKFRKARKWKWFFFHSTSNFEHKIQFSCSLPFHFSLSLSYFLVRIRRHRIFYLRIHAKYCWLGEGEREKYKMNWNSPW